MTSRTGLTLLAATLGGLGIWAAYLGVDEPTFTREALGAAARGLFVAAVAWAAVLGAGRLARSALSWAGLTGPAGAVEALHDGVAGFVALVAVLLPLGALGGLGPGSAAALAIVSLLGWFVPRPGAAAADPGLGWAVAVGIGALLIPGAVLALAPPTDTDELFWHLAAPYRLLREGELPGGWLDPVASRPMPLQLVYAGLLATGGPIAARLFHLGATAALLAGLYAAVRGHSSAEPRQAAIGGAWAVALLAGSWTLLEDSALAHDNVPTALCVLAAADAALRGEGHRGRLALAAGAALAIKYTAAPAIAAALMIYLWRRAARGPVRAVAEAVGIGLLALLVVAPWWVRNLVDGLHPLFPYAGWPDTGLVFAWPEKYGVGHGVLDGLRLPWDLVVRARTDSFVFLGRLHPAWVLFAPAVLALAVRDRVIRALLVATVVGLAGWFLGVQWIRHLIPLAPIAGLAWGLTMARLPAPIARVSFAAWLLMLPPQLLDHVERAGEAVPVATGEMTREGWLEQEVPGFPAIAWVNRHTPADARVALLYTGETALVERQVVLGSVEDHTPTRWLVTAHGGNVVGWLREQGVDYVVVQRVGFLRKVYPFLDDATFEAQFRAPEQTLRDALLHDATLVFEQGRHSVWALDLDGLRSGR